MHLKAFSLKEVHRLPQTVKGSMAQKKVMTLVQIVGSMRADCIFLFAAESPKT